jgi:conjugal transfer ATP-binding protein TraC
MKWCSCHNFCKQAGGAYLDGVTLRFNSFASVCDIEESAERIPRLLTLLTGPNDALGKVN